ncbi:hypothetical protein N7532_002082 [Penicillium argentinense]|uniref:Uncharacterized protein n=1 Tax=Penicillium argentinense TaxID=1131581 RepID=A0A9W9G597_9EURO|nr:uncharacterized protein N7532_002082 [Penicillium argentinense]KAJ5111547.1 hypothetical protein N7532_002082 [Penicillium argentinense]
MWSALLEEKLAMNAGGRVLDIVEARIVSSAGYDRDAFAVVGLSLDECVVPVFEEINVHEGKEDI